MTDRNTEIPAPHHPQAVDVDRRMGSSPGHSMRLLWSSVVFLWFWRRHGGRRLRAALGSPSFRDFQVELVEAELKRNPNFDNPLMMLPMQPSVFAVWLKAVPYAIAGVVFTIGVAFLAFAREAYGNLSLFMAAFFCGGCLLVGVPLFALSGHCLRWHFIPLGLGFFAIGASLCLEGYLHWPRASPLSKVVNWSGDYSREDE